MHTLCLSHGGPSVYPTEMPAEEAFVGTTDGITTLSRSPTGAWESSGQSLKGKHISALLAVPSRGLFLAGTHREGVYASTDGGKNWQRRDRGLTLSDIYALNSVEVGGEIRIYAGTEPAHLFISIDLGENWTEIPALQSIPGVDKWDFPAPPNKAHVKNVSLDPRSPSTIYVSVEQGGAFKSVDGGKSWRDLKCATTDVHRVVIIPEHPERLYVTSGEGIFHSKDAGETWEQLTDRSMRIGYPDALILHPRRPGRIFAAGAMKVPSAWPKDKTADARIARSDDGGKTWQILGQGLPEHIRGNIEAMSMNVWPGGISLFAATMDGRVFFSADEGENWSTIISGLAPVSKGGHHRLVPREEGLGIGA